MDLACPDCGAVRYYPPKQITYLKTHLCSRCSRKKANITRSKKIASVERKRKKTLLERYEFELKKLKFQKSLYKDAMINYPDHRDQLDYLTADIEERIANKAELIAKMKRRLEENNNGRST